uniref:LRRCT domain-containing protein n=1 Tax=Branchiostoma floridae TaxID=7739 RepID=C3XYV0_BRAFL|eukprot:XP_002610975.1 hypothetical protein BRAFLDRAFT_96294 [Branchiostoma floridae]
MGIVSSKSSKSTIIKIASIQPGTFTNLHELGDLDLSCNQITSIQPYTFTNPKLYRLYLHGNQITSIRPGTFTNLSRLNSLHLHENQISALPPSAHDMLSAVRVVEIDKNPWQCDCGMIPFRLKMTGFALFETQITCAQPDKFRGKKIKDINPEDLICNETTMSTLPFTSFTPAAVSTSSSFGNTESNSSPIPHLVGSVSVTQPLSDRPESINTCHKGTTTSSYHWYFKTNTDQIPRNVGLTTAPPFANTSDNESAPSFPLPVLTGSICGTGGGIVLIGVIVLTVWYKRRTGHPPSGQNSNVILTDTNTTATVEAREQIGQGQPQANTQKVTNLTHKQMLEVLKPNVMYAGAGTPQKDSTSTSSHDQAGQGQSQAITENNTNPTLAVTVSGHGQAGCQAFYHNEPSYNVGPTAELYKVVGRYQAIIKSNTNTTAAVNTIGHGHQYEDVDTQHDQTGQGQSQAITKSHTNTAATAIISDHDQIEQDQSHATTPSFDASNLAYSQRVYTSHPNILYTGVGSPPDHPKNEGPRKPESPNQSPKDEPPPLPPPREGADTLLAVSEPYIYEDVDSPLKSPNPKGTGTRQSTKNEALGKANKTKPSKEDPPPLPPSRRVGDALLAASQTHLYEDVDAPKTCPKPKGTGRKKFAKNEALGTDKIPLNINLPHSPHRVKARPGLRSQQELMTTCTSMKITNLNSNLKVKHHP